MNFDRDLLINEMDRNRLKEIEHMLGSGLVRETDTRYLLDLVYDLESLTTELLDKLGEPND